MAIDLKVLGRRLESARRNCGRTQEEAALAIGLPRTAIVHIEAGHRPINTVELAALADLYGVPVSFFFEDTPDETEGALVALCRVAEAFASDPAVSAEVARYVDICAEGRRLQEMLGRRAVQAPVTYDVADPKSHAEAMEQGWQAAEQERKRLGLGDVAIADMREFLVMQGIWASGARLPDQMSGVFIQHSTIGRVILVNFSHCRARKRFSYAHEYGHALLDYRRVATVTSRANAEELIERRANAFAAAMLMPKGGVEALLRTLDKGAGSRMEFHAYDVAMDEAIESSQRMLASNQAITYKDVVAVAHHFRASYQAACYRLRELGFVNRGEVEALIGKEPTANELMGLLGVLDDLHGKDKRTPDQELISQVVPIALEAYRREEISKARLRELGKKLKYRRLLELAEAA